MAVQATPGLTTLKILNDKGKELGVGEIGKIYMLTSEQGITLTEGSRILVNAEERL